MTKLLLKIFVKDYDNVENHIVRQHYGMLGGFVGIFCNIILFLSKFIAGLLTASIAIIADSFNNLSDAGSSIITLVGFKLSGAPADNKHPFGHGRIEYISGFIVSMIIILVGVELGKTSVGKIINVGNISFNIISLIILIVSILIKLWLGLFNKTLGEKINSSTMKANAMDSISDVISTIAVIISMLVYKFTGFNIDGYIGVLVALFICYTGIQTARDTLNPLLGEAPEKEFVEEIENFVLKYPNIVGVHDLIVHNYGPGRRIISLHAEVPSKIDILKIHDTIDNIERALHKRFDCEAVIHMDPIVVDDEMLKDTLTKVKQAVKSINSQFSMHDFRMVKGDTHTNLIFDIEVPFNTKMQDKEIEDILENKIKQIDNKYELIVNIDKSII